MSARVNQDAVSPASLSISSSRSFNIKTESEGEKEMTEEEVNALVHTALQRARKATTPNRNSKKPASPHTPRSPPQNIEVQTIDSFASPPQVQSPTLEDMDHILLSPDSDGASAGRGIDSVGSTDDIIRKVEEEIANARKAADIAHQRLVDALTPQNSRSWAYSEPQLSPSMELADILDDEDIRGILSVSSEDEDEIGVEMSFEAAESKDESFGQNVSFDVASAMINNEFSGPSPAVVPETVKENGLETEVAHLSLNGAPGDIAEEKSSKESDHLHVEEENSKQEKTEDEPVDGDSKENDKFQVEEESHEEEKPVDEAINQIVDDDDEYTEETVDDDDKSEFTEETASTNEVNIQDVALPKLGVDNDATPMQKNNENRAGAFSPRPEVKEEPNDSAPTNNGDLDSHPAPGKKRIWWTGDENEKDTKPTSTKDKKSHQTSPKEPASKKPVGKESVVTAPSKGKFATQKQTKKLVVGTSVPSRFEERELSREVRSGAIDGDSREIEFRHPCPLPSPLHRPRPTSEIKADNSLGIPERNKRWSQPKPELVELLRAVKGASMARRSNACGALKVLTNKKKNQLTLVRTKGFLEALVFAVNEALPVKDRETALDARSRAVAVLLKVSEPKDNRTIVFAQPGLPECLVKVVEQDQGEARVHACGALAMLAKSPENREGLVQVEKLVNILALVVNNTIDCVRQSPSKDENEASRIEDYGSDGFGSISFSDCSSVPMTDDDELSYALSSPSAASPRTGRKTPVPDSFRHKQGEMYEEYLAQARLNACAVFLHLSKHCAISDVLCENQTVLGSMLVVSREFENPIHSRCLEVVCNLTRLPGNTAEMARNDDVISTLLKAGKAKTLGDRVLALRAFQNMSADSTSKVILANSRILTLLSICAMRKDHDEQFAAVATLYNLSTEPGAVVPLTNTRNVVATLVHLAHNSVANVTIRQMASDALATIGLWLQTLAGSGKVPINVPKVLLPSHTTTGWQRWEQ